MIAVADTSPICYLILIGEIDLLPKLFSQVLVPEAVLAELFHEDAPSAVRSWASSLPPWMFAKEIPPMATAGLERLQAGERAAILLAEPTMADIVLLDEKAARRIAAILGEAATWGLVEVASAIDRLPDDELQGVPGAAEGDSRPLRHSLRPLKIALARRPVITQHMC